MEKVPIIREDDDEVLGFVGQDGTSWTAQTVFGYVFARANNRAAVERIVRAEGLSILRGLWQYFDRDDRTWFPCILKEAYEGKVTVIRTNAMGYQDPDDFKIVTLTNPTETDLVKA